MATKKLRDKTKRPKQQRIPSLDDPKLARIRALGDEWMAKRKERANVETEEEALADTLKSEMKKEKAFTVKLDSGTIIRFLRADREKLKIEKPRVDI